MKIIGQINCKKWGIEIRGYKYKYDYDKSNTIYFRGVMVGCIGEITGSVAINKHTCYKFITNNKFTYAHIPTYQAIIKDIMNTL